MTPTSLPYLTGTTPVPYLYATVTLVGGRMYRVCYFGDCLEDFIRDVGDSVEGGQDVETVQVVVEGYHYLLSAAHRGV